MLLLKTYSDAAGRTCRIVRDGTLYRVQYSWGGSWESVACHTHDRAEHLAAHHMATGVRLWCPSDPMTPENAQEPREAALPPAGVQLHPKRPKTILQRLCNGLNAPCHAKSQIHLRKSRRTSKS